MILHNAAVDVILTRRSIRCYQKQQISSNELETILEAGSYAPSGKNQQSAKAVVVQSKTVMQKLVRLAKAAAHVEQNPFYDAPTVVLVFADAVNLTPMEDGCNAIENMMLAAHALGLGSCWIYAAKVLFSTEEGVQLQKEWGLSEAYQIVGSFAVGYPAGEIPLPKPRNGVFHQIV